MNAKVAKSIRASFYTGRVYTPTTLARFAGVSPTTASNALKTLAGEGSVYKFGRGRYRVTEFGPLAEGKSYFIHNQE